MVYESIIYLIKTQLKEKEDVRDFLLWAFGEDYGTIHISESPTKWNLLHCEILEISGDSDPFDDLPKMIGLWRNSLIKKDTWDNSNARWSDK